MTAKRIDPARIKPSDTARFHSKVSDQPTESGCLLWTASTVTNMNGNNVRGQFWLQGGMFKAPRVAWVLEHGEDVPKGLVVDHRCRNPLCVNAAHLRLITQKQNSEHRGGPQPGNSTGIRGITYLRPSRKTQQGQIVVSIKSGTVVRQRAFSIGKHGLEGALAAALTLRNEWSADLFTHNDAADGLTADDAARLTAGLERTISDLTHTTTMRNA